MKHVMPFLVLLVAVTFAVSPFFVTSFAGFDPALFPVPQDDPPVQPAGYAFSIWGLIYAWLIIGAGFGLWKRAQDPAWQPMRPALFVSLGLGTFWLAMAERTPIGATVLIWAMLVAALVALWRTTRADRWLQQAPVAIYAGWLTAASSVSIGLLLAGWGWTGATPAALVALVVALALALNVQARLPRAPEYGLTVIWALVAVVVQNAAPLNAPVAGLAALGVVLMAGLLVWRRGA
ncbi:tryptophan-rich sensory protein [Pararhodobacter zhoushanensis]|uniref:Tryptophan-rich sensory protein n=1 Tax=Pararhodobacter zhoushanensis TaxID=2479545 RepID=A0ABT3GTM6_9RHOB|nr:tryptophan-rich sensory protein [Pararhodobacter zhoushanensis]MCW1930903.1 tryptophan-rich sensory protein [Pararhodobacter zhoushanensis]